MTNDVRLKIAVQKSGRLADLSSDLLKSCGIKLTKSKDQLFCRAKNFPLDVFFVRDDDIPAFVATDVCQIGMVGENVLYEKLADDENDAASDVETIMPLGFGECRLCIATPHGFTYDSVKSLEGLKIATSYAGILRKYLNDNGVKAEIMTMEGAVEIAPRTGMADVICDLVSTGATLASNGLTEVDTILESQAVLIKNKNISDAEQAILDRLILRLKGVRRAETSKYIMLHTPLSALEEIKAALPGSESPTVIPLQGFDDKVAIHAVCEEGVFWDTMEELKAKGASSILVLPIEKMLD